MSEIDPTDVGNPGCTVVTDEATGASGRFCQLATDVAMARRIRLEAGLASVKAALLWLDGLEVEVAHRTLEERVGTASHILAECLRELHDPADVLVPIEAVTRDAMIEAALTALDKVYGGSADAVSLFQQAVAVADAWHGAGWLVIHLAGMP